MDLTEVINKRRSVRKFKKEIISFEDLNQIIKAGIMAPSAKNRQPWFFYIINDQVTKELLLQKLQKGFDDLLEQNRQNNIQRPDIESARLTLNSIEQASALIIVTHKKKYSFSHDDNVNWYLNARDIEVSDLLSIGAAIENMTLKATDMGYGSLWVCDIFYVYAQIVEFLQTQDAVVSAICIGYSNELPIKKSRLPLEDVCFLLNEGATN